MQAHLASLLLRRVCPFDGQGSGLHAFNVLSQLNPRRRQFARELLMLGFPQTYRQAVTYRCVSPEPIAGAHRSPTQFAPQAQREDGARVPRSAFRYSIFCLSLALDDVFVEKSCYFLPAICKANPHLRHVQ